MKFGKMRIISNGVWVIFMRLYALLCLDECIILFLVFLFLWYYIFSSMNRILFEIFFLLHETSAETFLYSKVQPSCTIIPKFLTFSQKQGCKFKLFFNCFKSPNTPTQHVKPKLYITLFKQLSKTFNWHLDSLILWSSFSRVPASGSCRPLIRHADQFWKIVGVAWDSYLAFH